MIIEQVFLATLLCD